MSVRNPEAFAWLLAYSGSEHAFRGEEGFKATEARGYCLIPQWKPSQIDLLIDLCNERPLIEICPDHKRLGQFLCDIEMLGYRGCAEPTEFGPLCTYRGMMLAERFTLAREAAS